MTTSPIDLDQTICVACGAKHTLIHTTENTITCQSCEATFDVVDSVPCLVRYQSDEALSLIEILSNLDETRDPPSSDIYALWARYLSEYHDLSERERDQYAEKIGGGIGRFLPHRHRQYNVLRRAIEGVDLTGKHVLDMGAGEGFDTSLIQSFGANVTAVEFSPISARLGAKATPGTRWFCGSVHAIPFEDNSFDHVFCVAAVHHFGSVPDAMAEMLRVLKPGGSLFTISDSYRQSDRDESGVIAQFNNDPAVLRGVNEGIPPFKDFFAPFHDQQDAVETTIFSQMVYGYPKPEDGKRVDLPGIRVWQYPEAYETLGTTAGGMSLRIKKLRSLGHQVPTLTHEAVRPAKMADRTAPKAKALAQLAQSIPSEFVNQPFPGEAHNTKFNLLNGWRARDAEEVGRTAYSRARWFMARKDDQKFFVIAAELAPENSQTELDADLYVMGQKVARIKLVKGEEKRFRISVAAIPALKTFAVEIVLNNKPGPFEDKLFRVRVIRFVTPQGMQLNKTEGPVQAPRGTPAQLGGHPAHSDPQPTPKAPALYRPDPLKNPEVQAFKPSYVWPNPAFPFRVYYNSDKLRIFIIENIQHNWEWFKLYSHRFRDTDVFLVYGGWYHSPAFAREAQKIFDVLQLDKSQFYFMYNSPKEQKNFSPYGFEGSVINHNTWLDETHVMNIRPQIKKRFNAIYVGRYSPFKRHYLASKVANVAHVAGNNHNNPQSDGIPKPVYKNDAPLSPDEVCNKINESHTGLILSSQEGACFASSEYLLCGIPVVSTVSTGGRDVWYDSYNSYICEDDPLDVAEGVQHFLDNPRDPRVIRRRYIELSHLYRQKFTLLLANLFEKYQVNEDPQAYFEAQFIHKLRKSYTPDFEEIFPKA